MSVRIRSRRLFLVRIALIHCLSCRTACHCIFLSYGNLCIRICNLGHLRIVISNIISLNCLLDLFGVCRSCFRECSRLGIGSRGVAISDFGILEWEANKSHAEVDDWADMQCRVHRVGWRRGNGCLPEERGIETREVCKWKFGTWRL